MNKLDKAQFGSSLIINQPLFSNRHQTTIGEGQGLVLIRLSW